MNLWSLSRVVRQSWQRHPLPRDIAVFSTLFVGAELLQQTMLKKVWKQDKNPNYDVPVLARYLVFGVAFYPLIYYKWYRYLDRTFPGKTPSAVAKKVLVDQFGLEPYLVCAFYVGMSAMEGQEDIFEEAKLKFLPTFAVGCLFWMPATAINFFFVAPTLRVIFVGVCSFSWCNFRCWMKRKNMVETSEQSSDSDAAQTTQGSHPQLTT